MEQQSTSDDATARYILLDNYDWDNDREFQNGLRTILTSASPDQAPRLILRARCYYFARKFSTPVDFAGYQHWTKTQANGLSNEALDQPSRASTLTPSMNEPSVNIGSGSPSHIQQQDSSNPQIVDSISPSIPSSDGPAHPASFAEICELIALGKPIPGIKEIPDTVLEGQATASQAPRRKKPWEKDDASAAPASTVSGFPSTSASTPAWARSN